MATLEVLFAYFFSYFLLKKKVGKENFRRSLKVGVRGCLSLRLFYTLESQPNTLGNHNFIPLKHVSDGYTQSSFCLLFLSRKSTEAKKILGGL